jgi:hypothetical protein
MGQRLSIFKTRPKENKEENKSCVKILVLKIRHCSFWYKIHSKKLQNLQENVQRFHEVQS